MCALSLLNSQTVGYENKVRRSKLPQSSPGYMPLYTGSFNSHGRARSKAQKKSNWYKSNKVKDGQDPANRKNRSISKKKGNQTARKVQPSTVIFVPNTRGGLLTKKLKEKELCKMTGLRVKFQEAGGLQLKNCFSTDLSRGDHCGRKVSPPCEQDTENRQNCQTQNILYETKCLLCNPPTSTHKEDAHKKPASRNGIYYGESSRSFQERMAEHEKDADTFFQKSHAIKQWIRKSNHLLPTK